jgi:hypothetical protein
MDACVCDTSYKFKKHYIWTYHEVPKTHDNEDCVICIECVYIINIIQCTCEFLKTSSSIQKNQNYYFENMKFELYILHIYIYTHTHNRFD